MFFSEKNKHRMIFVFELSLLFFAAFAIVGFIGGIGAYIVSFKTSHFETAWERIFVGLWFIRFCLGGGLILFATLFLTSASIIVFIECLQRISNKIKRILGK
jgi:hypothetical protein